MPIAKSNGAVAAQTSVSETAPAPVNNLLAKRVLETPKAEDNRKEYKQPYKERDFEAEARGKVACVAFNAALASPGIAGLQFANIDEYLALVRKAADASVAYTWEKQK